MTLLSTFADWWMGGLCPKSPAFRTTSMILLDNGIVNPSQPDGGSGGSERILRGIRFATGGVHTLARNKQLLWFSLLTGLAILFMFIANYMLKILGTYPYDALDFPRWTVLTFAVELVTVFCITVLLAGLILSISPGNGKPLPFRDGLSLVKVHLRPLADWSVIVALAGTAIYVCTMLPHLGYTHFILYPVAHQFPFGFIFLPEAHHIGPIGGTYAMLYALTSTATMAATGMVLSIITLFVVPLIVLENRSLPDAVTGSFALMKNVLAEILTVFLAIGVVLFATSFLSLLFEVTYRIVAPEMQLFWYPGNGWIAAAVLFILVLCALAFIGSTVAGIAVTDLYRYAKTRKVSVTPEGEQKATGV